MTEPSAQLEAFEKRVIELNRLVEDLTQDLELARQRADHYLVELKKAQRQVAGVNKLISVLRAFKLGDQAAAIKRAMNDG